MLRYHGTGIYNTLDLEIRYDTKLTPLGLLNPTNRGIA